eukprot:jgi/Psemu1/18578/gm1.18578_g
MGKVPSTTPGAIANRVPRTANQARRASLGPAPRSSEDYKVCKENLATLGGSKYMPDVGVNITKLKRLSQMDFAPDPLVEADNGKPIHEPDPIKKKVAKQMQEEELKIKKVFAVAYGQLDYEMKDRLWSNNDFDKLESCCCVVKLLEILNDICYQGSKTKIHPETNILACAFRKLICCQQWSGNLSEYSKSVTDTFEVFKSLGGFVTYERTIIHKLKQGLHQVTTYAEYFALPDDDPKKIAIMTRAEQSFLATILIKGCDEETSTLKETPANQYTLEMLQQFKGTKTPTAPQAWTDPTDTKDKESTVFVNKGEELSSRKLLMVAAEEGEDFGDLDFHLFFQATGQIMTVLTTFLAMITKLDMIAKPNSMDANPNTFRAATTSTYSSYEQDNTSMVTNGIPDLVQQTAIDDDSCSTAANVSFPQIDNGKDPNNECHLNSNVEWLLAQTRGGVNPNWILLNSKNDNKKSTTIHCNLGSAKTNKVAEPPRFGVVWFYEDGIANALYLALVTDQF